MNLFRRITNRIFQSKFQRSKQQAQPSSQDFIGRLAKTLTPLKTSGYIELDGKKLEVNSIKGFVPQGVMVRIIGKQMSWFLVEPM